jgi:flagellar protein FliJ
MPKFKFRLATLLKLREAARDERRLELAEAYRVDDMLRQRLDGIRDELDGLRRQCRADASRGPVDVDRLMESQRYELSLNAQQRDVQAQRETVAAEMERRRLALVEANREVRVLENLREKQTARHRQEEDRREINRMDEVSQRRVARQGADI